MRASGVAGAIVAVAVGCNAGPAARSPATTPRSRGVPVASATASASALPLPPPLEPARDVACTLTARAWPRESLEDLAEGRVYLRFVAGGPAFAELFFGTDARLALPAALASAGGTLTLDAHGVAVQGHLEAAEMPLYPAVAFVMSEVFIPNHELRLLWRSAKPGRLAVAAQPIHRVEPEARELTAERECRDISLGGVMLDDAAIDLAMATTATRAPPQPPWPWLRSGRVSVSAAADDDTVATIAVLEPRDDTRVIVPPRVLAVDKGHTRIALSGFGGVLFGWVPSKQLTTSTLQYLDLSHDAFSLISPPRPGGGNFVACAHDVPLVAEAGGERRLVGTIRSGTRLEPLGTLAGWRRLELPDAGIRPATGASFWSRESDLAGCAPEVKSAPR